MKEVYSIRSQLIEEQVRLANINNGSESTTSEEQPEKKIYSQYVDTYVDILNNTYFEPQFEEEKGNTRVKTIYV